MNPESGNNRQESPQKFLDRMRGVLRDIAKKEAGDPDDEQPQLSAELTRRQALRRVGYGVSGLGLVAVGVKLTGDIKERNELQEAIYRRSDEFFAEVSGYEAQVSLRFDEVLFVDEAGAPMAIIKMEDFEIDRDGKRYLLTPGIRNEFGIVEGGIAGEWLEYVRQKLSVDNPDLQTNGAVGSPRALTVHTQFNSALNDENEPTLASRIKNGDITTYEEIIRYFANKPTVDAPELTREEFVQNKIIFDEAVHPVAQIELRRLITGLCAQESNFHNGLVSPSNARGIFQILEEVWVKDYGRDPKEFSSLKAQVEVAGKHLSRMYLRMQDKAGDLAMQQLRVLHPDQDILQTEVLVPLTLNSYNAGPDRVGEAVRKYYEVPENRAKKLTGRDLFLDIAEFANVRTDGLLESYGQHAREYVSRIYAKTAVLTKEE